MQFQRQCMRNRISKRYARIHGQHGDGYVPAYYPFVLQPCVWGPPWYKPKDAWQEVVFMFCVVVPWIWYAMYYKWIFSVHRSPCPPRGPTPYLEVLWFNDMDDPDYYIKKAEVEAEMRRGDDNTHWGGTNFLASYQWMPGDPEPDIRRKAPHAGHGHHDAHEDKGHDHHDDSSHGKGHH